MRGYVWLTGASIALCSCERPQVASSRPQAPTTEVRPAEAVDSVAGFRVHLVDSNPCALRYSREASVKELLLKVSSPCVFHRDPSGALRVQRVKDRTVFLIESSVHDPDQPGDCKTEVQGITVSPTGLTASSQVERVAMCTPFQWDEVMFIGLSAPGP